ncbi:hypothetical protein FQN55_004626 [Onygenales sp. PD_40]|nr:hypothetical protein FQN55_004626 [Onygenales sp. PD_40]KAK2788613.1 hypothetical protein FQN52_006556 [Onygenales sp. PD_12]KAK2795071.1 hypothetical protein FQN51_000587 [Onygenales sp. PD_10]
MPAPLAKGIVITVTILVAAGIAIYESPQVKQWVRNSRRKIAVALHDLGDEINPPQGPDGRRNQEDISMIEDTSEEAETRRRKAREEIMRRASILEARKSRSSGSVGSFDDLVDQDGRLKNQSKGPSPKEESKAQASGVDVGSDTVHRRSEAPSDISKSFSDLAPKISQEHRQAILDNINTGRPPSTLPSETSSNHPSESLVGLTPTSEFPDTDFAQAAHPDAQQGNLSQSGYFSLASSQHTEDGEPDFYYARPPEALQNATDQSTHQSQNPFEDPQGAQTSHDVSSAPSIASSFSHIQNEPFDHMSDGTLSDFGSVDDGIRTPASWSEIGSVVSGDDGRHQ